MQIVFATGQPGQLNINLVSKRDFLPAGARILATCSGAAVTELLDPITFHAMTRKEFYALQVLTCKARFLETQMQSAATTQPARQNLAPAPEPVNQKYQFSK